MAEQRTLEGETDLGYLERAVRSAGQVFVYDADATNSDLSSRSVSVIRDAKLAYWITGGIAGCLCLAVLYLA